jgi:hypothetical protein
MAVSTVLMSLFLGCGSSDTEPIDIVPPDNEEQNPTLMEALKNPKANELAGEEGVYIVFVQMRDGATMVEDVEALDTLYFLSAEGVEQTHLYETDKHIDVLRERVIGSGWGGTILYHPIDLPEIDFEHAYAAVKEVAGDRPIANLSIRYTLVPSEPLIVAFTLEGESAGFCDEYDYTVGTGEAVLAVANVGCFFRYEDS